MLLETRRRRGIEPDGSGGAGRPINNGDLEGNTSPFRSIVTNPIRGTYEAYAVTNDAVRAYQRYLFAGTDEQRPDGQGRVLIATPANSQ